MATDLERGSARIVTLLKLIAESDGRVTIKGLREKAGLPPSTLHRLLQVMVAAGLLERAQSGVYRTGREYFRLASLVLKQVDYKGLARPVLRALRDRCGETSVFTLYQPAKHCLVVAEVMPASHPLRFVVEPLEELSLLWGSLGRAVLAELPQDEVEAAFANREKGPMTGRRPPRQSELAGELKKVKERGAAFYRSDELDIVGVAAPVMGPAGGVIGSVGVIMPAHRCDEHGEDELIDSIIESAAELNTLFGAAPATKPPASGKPKAKSRTPGK